MPDGMCALVNGRKPHDGRALCEGIGIARRDPGSRLVRPVEVGEPHHEERRLQLVETCVPTDHVVVILRGRAVVAQPSDRCRECAVVRRHRAGVPEGAEVLHRIEAEPRAICEPADPALPVARTVGLGRVLDDLQAAKSRELQDRRHVGRLAEEVHWDDRPRPWRDGLLDPLGIDREGVGARIDRHRDRPHRSDREECRDERVARHDDLVTGADAEGGQRERQCVEPTAHPNAVFRSAIVGEFLLEPLELLAQYELPAVDDSTIRGVQVPAVLVVVAAKGWNLVHRHDRPSGAPPVLNTSKSP